MKSIMKSKMYIVIFVLVFISMILIGGVYSRGGSAAPLKEGFDNEFLTNTPSDTPKEFTADTKFTAKYSFPATFLMVAKGGAAGSGGQWGGQGAGYYYTTKMKFIQDHEYEFKIKNDGSIYTFTDLTNGSTITCDSGSSFTGGKATATGDFADSSAYYSGKNGVRGDNAGGNADAYRPQPQTVVIGDRTYRVGGAGGGARKYAANYSGEYDTSTLIKLGVTNYDAGGGKGRDSTTGENKEVNAYSYGNGGGAGQTRGYSGGAGSGGALVIYYSTKDVVIPTTAVATTAASPAATTSPVVTTQAFTPAPTTLPSALKMTPIATLKDNEFYLVPPDAAAKGQINSNSSKVTGVDNRNIPLYFPNGTYLFSASSTANINTAPYMAFDNNFSSYWQCDFAGNGDNTVTRSYNDYKTNPYALDNYVDNTAPYVGGGDKTNKWSTKVNGVDVHGEWLQLQIPFAAYVHQYSIYTPIGSSWPFMFVMVGSNDGLTWSYVDQQNEVTSYYDNGKNANVMTYNVNSVEKFSFLRLVATELSRSTPFIQICGWNIIGGTHREKMENLVFETAAVTTTTTPTHAETTKPKSEAFTSLSRSMDTRNNHHGHEQHATHLGSMDHRMDHHLGIDHGFFNVRDRIDDAAPVFPIYIRQDNTILYLSAFLGILTLVLFSTQIVNTGL